MYLNILSSFLFESVWVQLGAGDVSMDMDFVMNQQAIEAFELTLIAIAAITTALSYPHWPV